MSDISLSKAVRSNLLSLQSTATMMAKTQERLATGNKVNSALDNPTNFFTASGLNSRAGDLNQLMDSMANGIQTLEAADNGLTAITKTLESMSSTLRQARQDKSFQTASYSIALGDTPAGTEQLSLSGGAIGGTPVDIALTTSVPGSPATNAVATGTSWTDVEVTGSDLTFEVNGEEVTLAVGTHTAADVAAAINGVSAANVNASVDGSGNLVVTSTGTAGDNDEVNIDTFSTGDATA